MSECGMMGVGWVCRRAGAGREEDEVARADVRRSRRQVVDNSFVGRVRKFLLSPPIQVALLDAAPL